MTNTNKCNSDSILQDDDGAVFVNNSKYEVTTPAGTIVYPCPICHKWFKSLEDFEKHNPHNTSEEDVEDSSYGHCVIEGLKPRNISEEK